MKYYMQSFNCLNCYTYIDNRVFDYSINYFNRPLCISCQEWYKIKVTQTTQETIELYFSLRERGVPATLEYFDGHKTIDIAVEDARVNIEVDGPQHNFNYQQALSDLQRTLYAFQDGFLTLRIPNTLIRENLDETAYYITKFLNLSASKIRKVSY